jgi:hypothetical protein
VIRKTQEYKALWVLQNFSPSELQHRTAVSTPYKLGYKYDSGIVKKDRYVKGCSIPASTIHRFQIPKNLPGYYTPREKSIKKLADFYERYQYHKLRSAGANTKDARTFANLTPDKIKPVFQKYNRWTRKIQSNNVTVGHDVELSYIQWGMAHSFHTYNDWENISKFSGLKKKKASRKIKRLKKYEH